LIHPPWSTDWENSDGLSLWERTVDDTEGRTQLRVDKLLKDYFGSHDTAEPLAYFNCTGDVDFLFQAGDRYYFYIDGWLTVNRMKFASPQGFLEHLRKGEEGQMWTSQCARGRI
jgi:hypothetical protein